MRSRPFSSVAGFVIYLLLVLLLPLAYLFFQSLFRTLLEIRQARYSAEAAQAFYLAEGASDYAFACLRFEQQHALAQQRGHLVAFERAYGRSPFFGQKTLAFETWHQAPLESAGSARFIITLESSEHDTTLTKREVHRITAIGTTASGVTQTVIARSIVEGPLNGILASGPILINGGFFERPFGGSVQTTLGTGAAITVTGGVNLQGPVRVGLPAATEDEYTIFGGHLQPAYTVVVHVTVAGGVYLKGEVFSNSLEVVRPIITGSVGAVQSRAPKPMPCPYPQEACEGAIELTEAGQALHIYDGHEDGRKGIVDALPGDGQILLCLQYLYAQTEGAENHPPVIFHAPTTLYLTGQNEEGFALRAHELYAVDDAGELLPNGVRIIVTGVEPPLAGTVRVDSNHFGGSIYAPQSTVVVDRGMPQTEPWYFGGIVGREVVFWMAGRNVTFPGSADAAEAAAAAPYTRVKPRLISWQNPQRPIDAVDH
jgi:hypothetical protein